ncbi:MAG: hypothetical protein GX242_03070 [Clostridiales bacterium]|nr:hypothetical protein [Clostridiales bacterium]
MREKIVGINKDSKAIDYICDCLAEREIKYAKECDDNQVLFVIKEFDEDISSLISEVIVLYYKFNEISKLLMPDGSCSYPYCAYIGSILSIDAELERKQIINMIPNDNFINIDGIYNFCLTEIRESWQSLAILCEKLISQCKTEKDMYSLTSFMLGVENESESTVTVDKKGKITIKKNGEKIKLPRLFSDPEMDAIATILANSPTEIIILKKEEFSNEFMTLMHKIGV